MRSRPKTRLYMILTLSRRRHVRGRACPIRDSVLRRISFIYHRVRRGRICRPGSRSSPSAPRTPRTSTPPEPRPATRATASARSSQMGISTSRKIEASTSRPASPPASNNQALRASTTLSRASGLLPLSLALPSSHPFHLIRPSPSNTSSSLLSLSFVQASRQTTASCSRSSDARSR